MAGGCCPGGWRPMRGRGWGITLWSGPWRFPGPGSSGSRCGPGGWAGVAAPWVLPGGGGVRVRVVVDEREVRIYSRPEDRTDTGEWTLHATGQLTDAAPAAAPWAADWPPPGAEPIDVTDFYADQAHAG